MSHRSSPSRHGERLFLVGPMGAGKTTIGRQLAAALGLSFVDSDKEIEARTGVDIPTIFDIEGEAGFRERESRILDELTAREGICLATGGGAVGRAENRERLKGRGLVIYLRCSVEQQLRRTQRDRNRPLLQTQDPRARLQALMAERDPLYCEVADLIIRTDQLSVRSAVQQVRHWLASVRDGQGDDQPAEEAPWRR